MNEAALLILTVLWLGCGGLCLLFARRKGYNATIWFFAGMATLLLSCLALSFLPFTNKGELSEIEVQKKRKVGDTVGSVLIVAGVILSVVGYVLMKSASR